MKISTWIFPLALLLSYPTSADADTLEAAGECLAGFISWLKQWQTLTAGVLALIAAWAAWKQLDFQRKESKSRQCRRVRACLAVLPVNLSVFMDYLEECYKVAVRALHALRSNEENPGFAKPVLGALSIPSVPDRTIADIQVLIEHLDDYNADIIAKVLRVYQVQNSRLKAALRFARENCDNPSAHSDMEGTFKETVFLFLLVENMRPFSREEAARIPPFTVFEERACNALHVLEQNLSVDERIEHDERKIFEYVNKAYSYYRFNQPGPQWPASS